MKVENIGFVVIGRNEGDRLVSCLKSILGSFDKVVYVDSGSTDNSVNYARELGVIAVLLDINTGFTAAKARNFGFNQLMSNWPQLEFIHFIDGDCELISEWVNKGLLMLQSRNDLAIVAGKRKEKFPNKSIYNMLCDIEWNTTPGEESNCGGDMLMRVSAFKSVNGFRSSLIAGEEPELCKRLRDQSWSILIIDEQMTLHDANIIKFSQWWNRMVRWGYACAEVCILHIQSRRPIWRMELLRAFFWGGTLPSVIFLSLLKKNFIPMFFLLVYGFKILDMILKRKSKLNFENTIWAVFTMLAHFAALYGVIKFFISRAISKEIKIIEYK